MGVEAAGGAGVSGSAGARDVPWNGVDGVVDGAEAVEAAGAGAARDGNVAAVGVGIEATNGAEKRQGGSSWAVVAARAVLSQGDGVQGPLCRDDAADAGSAELV